MKKKISCVGHSYRRLHTFINARLFFSAFLMMATFPLFADQVDIGVFASVTPNQMEVRIRPNYTEDGSLYITNAQFTIKWPVSSGLTSITSNAPISPFMFAPQGAPLIDGGYYYQRYASSGGYSVSWSSGSQIIVQIFTFTSPPCPMFEIADDAYVNQVSVNGAYYFEISSMNKTGAIYQATAQQPYPVAAGVISGTSSLCRPAFAVSYSVPEIANASTYEWIYSGTGATINGTGRMVTIDFNSSATSGNLTVRGVNGCGPGTLSPAYPVTISTAAAGGTATTTNAALCAGSNTVLTLTGYDGTIQWQQSPNGSSGWSSVTGGSGATTATYTTPALTITTYYRAQVTGGSCGVTYSNNVPIMVYGIPDAPYAIGKTICAGYPVPALEVVTGTGVTADWYTGSTGGSPVASGTLTYTPPSAGTWYAQARNTTAGCLSTSRSAVAVVVNPLPVVYAGDDRSTPMGTTITISDATVSGTAPLTWHWSPAEIFTDPNLLHPTTVNLTGPFDCILTVTDGNSCFKNDTVSLYVTGGALSVAPTASVSQVCAGNQVQLFAHASGGSGSYSYSWTSNPAGFTSSSENPMVTPSATTTYTVVVTSGGSPVSGNVTVTVIPTPVPPVSGGNRSVCANQTIPALTVSVNAGETTDWYAAPSGGAAIATGTLSYTPSSAGTWYAQTRNLAAGCISATRTAVTLTINSLPSVFAGADKSIPSGSSVSISDATASGTPVLTYSWTPAASFINPAILNPVTINLTSAAVFTLSVTDGNSCTNNDQMSVNVSFGTLVVNPSATPNPVCQGGNVQLSATPSGGTGSYSYSWTSNPAGFTSNLASPVVSPMVNTTYTVQVSDGFNMVSGIVLVTVNPYPAAPVAGVNRTICAGQAVPTLSVTTVAGNTADWYAAPAGGSPLATGTLSYTPSGAGTWYAQARNIATGCTSATRTGVTLTINPLPVVNAGADKAIPTGTAVTISDATSTGTPPLVYSWTPPEYFINPATLQASTVSLTLTNVYRLTVTDANLCMGSDQLSIVISGGSLASNAYAVPSSVCMGAPVQLHANASGGTGSYTYSWSSVPAGFSSTLADPGIIPAGTTIYTVTINDGSSTISRSVTVTVNPVTGPPASTGDRTICEGQSIPALAVVTGTGVTADWYSTPAGGTAVLSGNTLFTPPGGGTWYAEARVTASGCVSATRTAIAMNVNSLPPPPVSGGNKTVCGTQPFPALTVTTGTGITADWYTTASGGTPIATGTLSYTPASDGTYYVVARNLSSGCVSASRSMITLSVSTVPASPISGGNKTICASQPVPALTVTTTAGITADWYSVPAGGTPVATGTLSYAPPTGGTWYAEARNATSGCVSTSRTAIFLTINTVPPAPVSGGNRNICSNQPIPALTVVTGTGVTADWYALASGGTPLASGTVSFTPTSAGTWYAEARTTSTGCLSITRTPVTLAINPVPAAPVSTGNKTVCANYPLPPLSVTVGAGETADWYSASSGGTALVTGSVSYTPAAAGTFYAAARNATSGCVSITRTAVTLTVNTVPAAPASGGNKSVCANMPAPQLTVTTGTGVTSDWYNVSSGGSPLVSGTAAYTPASSGTYYAEARNNISGCLSTVRTPVTLTVNTLPVVYAGADKTIPYGTNVTMGDATASGPAPLTYSWTPPASFTNPGLLNPSTTNLTTTGNYTLTVTSGNNCTSSDQVTVNVTGSTLAISPSVNPPGSCSAGQVQLSANATGGSGSYTWSWSSNPAGFTSTLSNPSVTPLVSTTYLVTVNDGFTSVSGNVTVNPVPLAPVSGGNKTICGAQPIPALTVTTGTGVTADWYNAPTGGMALATGTLSYTPTAAGTYYAQARNISAGCLSAVRTPVALTINSLPVVYAGSDRNIPYGTAITVNDSYASGVPPFTYGWTPQASFVNPSLLNPQTRNLTVSAIYTLTVTDGNNCSNSDQMVINISGGALAVSPSASSGAICAGSFAQLTANPSGGSGNYSFTWTSLPAGYISSQQNPSVNPAQTTTYNVVVNDGYNTASGNITITVNAAPAAPVSGGDKRVCQGQVLQPLAVNIGSGETADWYAAASGGQAISSGTLTFTPPSAGTWYAQSRVITTGCISTSRTAVALSIQPLPAAPVSGGDKSICAGQPLPALTITAVAGETVDWYSSPSGGTALASGTLSYTPPVGGTFYAQARNSNYGCVSAVRTSVALTLNPLPVVFAGADKSVLNGTSTSIPDATASGKLPLSYSWSPAASFVNASLLNAVTKNITSSGNYTLTVTDGNNCSAGDQVTISVTGTPLAAVPSSSPAQLCQGSAARLAANASGGSGSYTYLWSSVPSGFTSVQPDPQVTPTATTAYTVLVNDGFTQKTGTVTVTVNSSPAAPASGGNKNICAGEAIPALTVTTTSGVTADWFATSGGGVALASGTLSFTPPGTGPWYAQARNTGTGCINMTRTAVSLTITPVPAAPVSLGDRTICAGDEIPVLSVSAGSGETADWYVEPTGGTPLASGTLNYVPYGGATFYVQARRSSYSCISATRTAVTLSVNAIPPPPVSAGNKTICAGQPLPAMVVTTPGGVTADWYTESFGGTALVTGTLSYTPPGPGTWYTEARNTTTGCLSSSRTKVVLTINPLPLVSAGADRSIPHGTSTIIDDATASGNLPLSYSWSPASSFVNANLLNPSTAHLATTGIYTLAVTDGNQCSSSDQLVISVTGGPLAVNPSVSLPAVCDGSSVQLSANVSGGSGSYTFAWTSLPAGFTSSQANPLVTPSQTTTYTLTVSDGFNQVTGSVAVKIHPNPAPPVSGGNKAICRSDTETKVIVTVGKGEVAEWNLVPSGSQPPGTTVYTWQTYARDSITGCRSTSYTEVSLTIYSDPAPPVSAGNKTICRGAPVPPLSVSAGQGETADWYTTPAGGTPVASSVLSFIPPDEGTWYAAARNISTGCVSTSRTAVTLNVNPLPEVFAGGDRSLPFGTSTIISDASVSGTLPLSWYWTPASSFTDAALLTPATINLTATNSYTLTVTDGNNCTNSDRMTITVTGTALAVKPSASATEVCSGTPVQLNGNVTGGSGTYTFSWSSLPAGFSSSQANPSVVPLVSTVYSLQVNDGFNTVSGQVTVRVNQNPPAPVSGGNRTACAGLTDPGLTVTVGENETADWYTNASGGLPVATGKVYFIPPGSGIYYAQARNMVTGCQSPARTAVTLTIHPRPAPPASGGNKSICTGQPYPELSVTAGPGESVDWYQAAAGGVATVRNSLVISPTGAGTWYAEAKNISSGCESTTRTPVSLTVNPIPTVFTGSDLSIPYGTSTTIKEATASGTAPLSYLWTPATAFLDAGLLNPSTRNLTATERYTLTVTDVNKCSRSDQMTIFVTGTALAINLASYPQVISASQSSQLTSNVSGGSGNYTYTWSSNPAGFISSSANPVVMPLITTTYTVRVSDGFNSATGSTTVIVNPFPSAPVSGGNKSICAGQTVPLLSVTAGPGEVVDWYAQPSGGTALATATFTFQPSAAGTWYAEARNTVTGAVSTSRTPIVLSIGKAPSVGAGIDQVRCTRETIRLTGALSDNTSSVTWTTNGKGTFTGINTLSPDYSPASDEFGLVRFILAGKGIDVCAETYARDTLVVNFRKTLTADAGTDTTILSGTTARLAVTVQNGTGVYTYQWSPGSQVVSNRNQSTETAPLTAATQFLVSVTDAGSGCTAESGVKVNVEESIDKLLLITNGITPNGDGSNDIWKIKGIESFPDNEVVIVNRWGDRIRQFRHYDNVSIFWDGTNEKGKVVPDGTYFYLLTIKDRKTYKGWIQLKSSL